MKDRDLQSVDLNLLTLLSLLLQTKSVTATARRLGVSQPSVSRSLAQIRQIFGDPLLIRSNGGMELTGRAEQLVDPLQRWAAATADVLTPPVFEPESLARRFRVASTDFGVAAVIAPALPHLHAAAPGAVIDVAAFSDDMFAHLAAGRLDLVVTGLEPDPSQVHSRHLFREGFRCVVRTGHELAVYTGKTVIPLDAYMAWPHITLLVGESDFDRVHMRLGPLASRRKVLVSLPYFQAAPALLESSNAVLTVPARQAEQLAANEHLAVLPPPENVEGFDYWVLWHERSDRDPATRWLVGLLAAHCPGE